MVSAIDFFDKSDIISVKCNDSTICAESNIAHKAAQSFFEFTKINGGAEIAIEKHIPLASGMGGGSADAAAVLRGLNGIFRKMTAEELEEMAEAKRRKSREENEERRRKQAEEERRKKEEEELRARQAENAQNAPTFSNEHFDDLPIYDDLEIKPEETESDDEKQTEAKEKVENEVETEVEGKTDVDVKDNAEDSEADDGSDEKKDQ